MGRLSQKTDNLPWMKFYPDSWRSDNALAFCSAEARGIWIEMLCCMWVSPQRGVLPGERSTLARLTRSTVEEVSRAIVELESYCVFSRGHSVNTELPSDSIVCRRMYREWHLSQVRSEAGRKGGSQCGETKARYGNKNALRRKHNADDAQECTSNSGFIDLCVSDAGTITYEKGTQPNTQTHKENTQQQVEQITEENTAKTHTQAKGDIFTSKQQNNATDHQANETNVSSLDDITYKYTTEANNQNTASNALSKKLEDKKLDNDLPSFESTYQTPDDVENERKKIAALLNSVVEVHRNSPPRPSPNNEAVFSMQLIALTGDNSHIDPSARVRMAEILSRPEGMNEIKRLFEVLREFPGDNRDFAISELKRIHEGGKTVEAA